MSFTFSFGNKTDVGMVREGNEDYLASFKTEAGHVFIVCDGMGGHASGEVASRLAVDTIKSYLEENADKHCKIDEVLTDALHQANSAIMQIAAKSPEYQGMGTTCVILLIKPGQAYMANVGDSRIYVIRNKKIYQLTKDQSFVQSLIDNGYLSYRDAESHPRKNELLQALGVAKVLQPDVSLVPLNVYRDDTFLLCSDGLSGMLNDDEILETSKNLDPIDASNALVERANKNGGLDNVTVQIVKILKGKEIPFHEIGKPPQGALTKDDSGVQPQGVVTSVSTGSANQSKKSKKSLALMIILSAVILFSVLLYFSFFWKKESNENIESKSNTNTSTNDTLVQNKRDSSLRIFFEKVYKGNETVHFRPSDDSGNVKLESIRYVDSKGNDSIKNFENLLIDIRKFGLKYDSFSRDTLIVTVKGNKREERKYLVNTEQRNDTIEIKEILFVKPLSQDKQKSEKENTIETPKSTNEQTLGTSEPVSKKAIDKSDSAKTPKKDTVIKK
jgi:serine/threonine protein phosphatase PrpC